MFRQISFILIGILFLLLCILVLLIKKPLCIDSKLVYRIDRVSNEGVHYAYSCQANRKVEYDEKLANIIRQVTSQTLPLQSLFSSDFRPLRVTILQGVQDIVRIQLDEIFLSQDQLENTTQLERSMLKIWLRQNLQNINLQKSFIEEALVDFMQATNGKAFERKKNISATWPMNMLSAGGKSLTQNLQFYVSTLLFESYLQLKLSERQIFMTQLLTNLKTYSSVVDLDALISNVETLDQAKEQLKIAVQFFARLPQVGPHLQEKINAQKIFENNTGNNVLQLDYLFEVGDSKSLKTDDVLKFFESSQVASLLNQKIGLVSQDEIWIQSQRNFVRIRNVTQLQVHQFVLIDCMIPDLNKIQRLAKVASKLLFVKRCQDFQKLQFVQFFKDGVEGFAKENLSTPFIQIHLSSLQQIWTDKNSNPLNLLTTTQYQNEFFKKIRWQKPIWDEGIQAYRSHSVVQSFDIFRN